MDQILLQQEAQKCLILLNEILVDVIIAENLGIMLVCVQRAEESNY